MNTSQYRRAVDNRCVFSARLKALSDRSGDRSAGGRRFHVAGPLTAKLRCPVEVRARGTSSRVSVAADPRQSSANHEYGLVPVFKPSTPDIFLGGPESSPYFE